MTIDEQIRRDEGLRLTAYADSEGKCTIGYGRCLETRGITQDEAEYLLSNDLSKVKIEVAERFPWSTELDDARRGVLLNMAFNLGVKGLSKFTQMLASLKAHDYETAAYHMLDSRWKKQVGDRAKRLAEQMRTGTWQ